MGSGDPRPSHSLFPCLTCSLEPPKEVRLSEVDPRKATTDTGRVRSIELPFSELD